MIFFKKSLVLVSRSILMLYCFIYLDWLLGIVLSREGVIVEDVEGNFMMPINVDGDTRRKIMDDSYIFSIILRKRTLNLNDIDVLFLRHSLMTNIIEGIRFFDFLSCIVFLWNQKIRLLFAIWMIFFINRFSKTIELRFRTLIILNLKSIIFLVGFSRIWLFHFRDNYIFTSGYELCGALFFQINNSLNRFIIILSLEVILNLCLFLLRKLMMRNFQRF